MTSEIFSSGEKRKMDTGEQHIHNEKHSMIENLNSFRILQDVDIASVDGASLHGARALKVNELLSEARVFMRNFHETVLRSDSQTDELLSRMRSSDEKFEELRNFVSTSASRLFQVHQRTVENILNTFQVNTSVLQSAIEKETEDAKQRLTMTKMMLESVSSGSMTEHAVKQELIENLHLEALSSIKATGTSKKTDIMSSLSDRKINSERQKIAELEKFREDTNSSRFAHGKLASQLRTESNIRHLQMKTLDNLRTKIEKLESRKASLETDALLKMEKEKALQQIANLKRKIHYETVIHEERLKHLALLFETAKSKIEAEIHLVEQTERAWVQLLKQRADQPRISDYVGCLDALKNQTLTSLSEKRPPEEQ
jgi:hypothetical protein